MLSICKQLLDFRVQAQSHQVLKISLLSTKRLDLHRSLYASCHSHGQGSSWQKGKARRSSAAPNEIMRVKKGGNSGKAVAKGDLPSKICVVCNRPFTWRKKWEKCWDDVKYCSERCRRSAKSGQGSPQKD